MVLLAFQGGHHPAWVCWHIGAVNAQHGFTLQAYSGIHHPAWVCLHIGAVNAQHDFAGLSEWSTPSMAPDTVAGP